MGVEGIRRFQEKDYAAAIERFQEALQIDPRNPMYYGLMAAAHRRVANHAKAIECARRAVDAARQINTEDCKVWEYPISDYKDTLITCLATEGSSASIAEVLSYLDGEEVGALELHAVRVLAEKGVEEAVGPIRKLLDRAVQESATTTTREALQKALDQLEGHGDIGADTSTTNTAEGNHR